MSAAKLSDALYRKCPVCYGTRATKQPVTVTSGPHTRELAFLSACPFCTDGYVPAGVGEAEARQTADDVLSLRDDRDALLVALGDASQESAEECLAKCLDAVSGRLADVDEANERLTRRGEACGMHDSE